MAPLPLQCSVLGCDYETGTEGTLQQRIDLLSLHTSAVHAVQQPQQHVCQTGSKLEKLPRPVFTLNMTEAAWDYKVIEWESYIQQTTATDNAKLLQLRAACDDGLRSRVYDSGDFANLNNVTLLLARMKELAVVTVHKSVHIMNLYKMVQQSDENIRAFSARLTGTADMCGMSVRCVTCQVDISYRDEVVKQIIITGMFNLDIRQRVLSRTKIGELPTLSTLVEYIAAEEASVTESHDLHRPASASLSAVRRPSTSSSYKNVKKPCNYCGGPRHSPSNSLEDRKKMCRAFGKSCSKCGRPNHLSNVCRSSQSAGKVSGVKELGPEDGLCGSITVNNLYGEKTSYPAELVLNST